MNRRGRPKSAEPKKLKSLHLPIALQRKIDLLLLDPVLGKPEYGGWSELVEKLLREWIVRQQLLHASTRPLHSPESEDAPTPSP